MGEPLFVPVGGKDIAAVTSRDLQSLFSGFEDPRRQYTQVPDYLLDFLLPDLPGSELKILLYLIRHAFGYGRESVAVSWSRFLEGTVTRDGKRLDWGAGVRRDALKEGIPSLAEKGLIEKERQSSGRRGNEASLYTLRIKPSCGEDEPSRGLAGHQGFFRIPNSTNVPNQLFDALLPHLTEGELKVLAYIIRRTIGMKVEDAAISYAQFAQGIMTEDERVLDRGTGLSEATIKRALKGLEEKRCIVRERPDEPGSAAPSRYRLYFTDDAHHSSRTTQGEAQKSNKGELKSPTSAGVQQPHEGGLKCRTHETQGLNTEKHRQEIQQQGEGHIEDIVVALISVGVTSKVAERLAGKYSTEKILAQIDMLSYRDAKDPAAMLVRAIEEEWAPPAQYETPEEHKARAAEEAEARAAWERELASQSQVEPKPALERPRAISFRPFTSSQLQSHQLWATALMELARVDGAASYLAGSVLLGREGDEMIVGVATAYAAGVLQRRLAHEAAKILSALGGEQVRVRFVGQADSFRFRRCPGSQRSSQDAGRG